MSERLEAASEPALDLTGTFGKGPDDTVVARQVGYDEVCFSERDCLQDDTFCPAQHHMIFPKSSGLRFFSHSSSSSAVLVAIILSSTKIGALALRATATASLGRESIRVSFLPSLTWISA